MFYMNDLLSELPLSNISTSINVLSYDDLTILANSGEEVQHTFNVLIRYMYIVSIGTLMLMLKNSKTMLLNTINTLNMFMYSC